MCIRSSEGTAVSNASSSQPEVSSAKLKSLVSTLLDSADQQPLEVFPRFKGPDVHKSFADCLYSCLVRSKIRTFRNAEELHDHKGKKIALLSSRPPVNQMYISQSSQRAVLQANGSLGTS
ncbi:unnamed protein product [Linum tenue]|uniref:Uncharacterized protein n=1 Tax=Linum tenue TaxID=586396 RepID=A0AAV0HHQ1_9ROSI|nr:unnamed protein product [Linum tenue]